jgi:hypothetical protein|nr:MAG TPA: hypothetical protein [Crassvirales sp.]
MKNNWIKDENNSAIGMPIVLDNLSTNRIVSIFKNGEKKITVCSKDDLYTFIETEGDSKNWKQCPSVPIDIIKQL